MFAHENNQGKAVFTQDLTNFFSKIQLKHVVAAIYSIQRYTGNISGKSDGYVDIARIGDRILYFDRPDNHLLRSYRDMLPNMSRVTSLDYEDHWIERGLFYATVFPFEPATSVLNAYQVWAQQQQTAFKGFIMGLEDLMVKHIAKLLQTASPFHEFIEPHPTERGKFRIPLKKLEEFEKLILLGYRNDETFALYTEVDDIEDADVIFLDEYAFDVNELLQLEKGKFFINPHTGKEFSDIAKTQILTHPKLAQRANDIHQEILMAKNALSNATIKAFVDFNSEIQKSVLDSKEEAEAINKFNIYYLQMPQHERNILDAKSIMKDTFQGMTQVQFGPLYRNLIHGNLCKRFAKECLDQFSKEFVNEFGNKMSADKKGTLFATAKPSTSAKLQGASITTPKR